MTAVLLLKSPAEDLQQDPYQLELSARGFKPFFTPVLDTVFARQDELQNIIRAGPGSTFSGVTVTSARAAEAWKIAAQAVAAADPHLADASGWSCTPFYAVGDSTARALTALATVLPRPLAPNTSLILGAAESGTGEALAHYIVDEYRRRNDPHGLLELVGDKNKDTLPSILRAAGISSQRLQVYGTGPSRTFERDLAHTVLRIPEGDAVWIVLFAPSATQFSLPFLEKHFILPGLGHQSEVSEQDGRRPTRLATIGPTTATFLRDKLSLDIAVAAPKPDAIQLAAALAAYPAQQ
ncbi:tetrapyrrole biosynthesis, uroporphyrinogen III synthase [Auricularia subglabra TFB-10046 SS5]|uniref:Tetrapyrrole biosynthesis, uroporphyrinogen III synthase n=1 Tax=Auricularia subglabra (strain TFB-10046 / SS5) TaxID=717982 RepID=J0D797_AURST|nr:tetrapyrrole biosynthesis, uroporphyrinogen III synthase [Auricularia subglabra TFB-10046 SS5]